MSETETIKEDQLSTAETIAGKFARKCQHCDFSESSRQHLSLAPSTPARMFLEIITTEGRKYWFRKRDICQMMIDGTTVGISTHRDGIFTFIANVKNVDEIVNVFQSDLG